MIDNTSCTCGIGFEQRLDLLHRLAGARHRGAIGQLHARKKAPWSSSGRKPVGVHAREQPKMPTPISDQQQHRQRSRRAAAAAPPRRSRRARGRCRRSTQRIGPRGLAAMAQEHGAQRRRQGQRVDRRDQHRHADGDRELAEQRAGDAGNEGDRHEHRQQHQRDRDDRAGDLPHRLLVASPRRQIRVLLPSRARRSRPRRSRRRPRCRSPAPARAARRCWRNSPAASRTAKVPIRLTGTATAGNDRRAQVAEEQEHDEHDQRRRPAERLSAPRRSCRRRTTVNCRRRRAPSGPRGSACRVRPARACTRADGLHRVGVGREIERRCDDRRVGR